MSNKTCKKCKQQFPATREYFYKALGNKDGLFNICKDCHNGNKPVRKTKAPKGYIRPRSDDTVRILTDSEVLSKRINGYSRGVGEMMFKEDTQKTLLGVLELVENALIVDTEVYNLTKQTYFEGKIKAYKDIQYFIRSQMEEEK